MKILYILRGIPGSGKTTLASTLVEKYVTVLGDPICCADDYHMDNVEYKWKAENQGYAHKSCQKKCEELMKIEATRIVVANTNTTIKEMKPYVDLAKEYGYTTFYLIVENRINSTNVHNVPESTINKMKERFEISL